VGPIKEDSGCRIATITPKQTTKSNEIRGQYQITLPNLAAGWGRRPKAPAEAKTIMGLETKLAEASLTNVERRDPEKTYHKMSRPELRTLTPNWSWDNLFPGDWLHQHLTPWMYRRQSSSKR